AKPLHKEVMKPVVLLFGCNYACYILKLGTMVGYRMVVLFAAAEMAKLLLNAVQWQLECDFCVRIQIAIIPLSTRFRLSIEDTLALFVILQAGCQTLPECFLLCRPYTCKAVLRTELCEFSSIFALFVCSVLSGHYAQHGLPGCKDTKI
ncbi:NHX3, partial [Symbiodinium sp. CCMP2456]